MTVRYRSGKPSDVSACVTILADWVAETPWMPPLDGGEKLEAFWSEIFERDSVWVAEKGRVVGFCTRDEDNIGALYVVPGERGSGIGKRLLDLAKEDREWITVWAFEKNAKARAFYRREGLVEVSREVDESGLEDVEHRWTRPSLTASPGRTP